MPITLRPLQRASQQSQADLFQYQSLESQNTFRLLRLHAGQGERITCSLRHYTLGAATCPPYRAVSYTWGQDAARFNIHLPGDAVIKVRENLRNALRSLRDWESDCWLWIDAICINQASNEERNHQVRLMADIYGNANVVLVWLQSLDEKADVARAFRFVHAAATYDNSEHSVYHYCKSHLSDNERNWRSLQNLCRLRYWTRKWIIQEVTTARSAVLQMGNSKCSMTDLETFCRQLHQNRDNNAYKKLNAGLVDVSLAARLALQRLEIRDEQQPRFLHELVERYSSSECGLPCDHVYALYSLVGDHRQHLSIDYGASPVQRLVAVLHFIHTHERLQPSKVLGFVNLLMRLFKLRQEDILQERRSSESLNLTLPATLLGTVELQPESEGSIAQRRMVDTLQPMPTFVLDTSQDIWVLTTKEDPNDAQERVGRPDMTYFRVAGSSFHGLAACRLEPGDAVWHLPEAQLVFAVREYPGHRALIFGRAYLFSAARNHDALEHWLSQPFDYNGVRQGERHVSMHLATLLELGSLAILTQNVNIDPKMIVKTSLPMNDVKAVLKKNWSYKVVLAGCSKSTDFH